MPQACAGLLPLSAGRVRVLDGDVLPGRPAVISQIGFAPDTPPVYEGLSVIDFLRFVSRAYGLQSSLIEERIDFWLEQLWLADRREAKIKSLSRRMRQRLTVARTLLPDPVLVLLDEPAAGLDPAGRVQFRRLLRTLADSGKALIVSSHILADLHEYCTHIGIMAAGRLVQFGTVAQVVGAKEDNRCACRVVLAVAVPQAPELLTCVPGLSRLEVHGRRISFEFEHVERAAAELLARLLREGLPVSSFAPVEHDLDQAYLRTGIRQVD